MVGQLDLEGTREAARSINKWDISLICPSHYQARHTKRTDIGGVYRAQCAQCAASTPFRHSVHSEHTFRVLYTLVCW